MSEEDKSAESAKQDDPNENVMARKVSRRAFVGGTVGGLVVGAVAGAVVGSLGFPRTTTETETATQTSTATSTATQTATQTATSTTTVAPTPSFLIPPAPIPDSQISKTVQADIIIVGAGQSGLVCANSAVEQGAKVVVFAASSGPVGRGGSVHAYNSTLMQKLGLPVNLAEDFKKMMTYNSWRVDQDKYWVWANKSGEAVDWVSEKMVAAGYTPVIERGNTDPDNDIFTMGIGSHSWLGGGVTSAGASAQLMANTLAQTATAAGVQIDYSMTAKQLVRENNNTGRVTAVIAQAPDNTYTKYVGSKAIVLATGDFTLDKEMAAYYSPWAAGIPGGIYSGDGHKMGLWVGAAWQNILPNAPMQGAFGGPAPNPYQSSPALTVNANGERFFNEDCGLFSMAGPPVLAQPGQKAFAIWDSNFAEELAPWYPFGSYYGPEPGQTSPPQAVSDVVASWNAAAAATPPTMSKASTIDDLATALGLDPTALTAAVNRYNGFCTSGVDEDFHKRSGLLFPVSTPPFYGAVVAPTMLILTGGLRTNANMQVLDNNNNVIPGLYAVGTIVGDMYEGIYTFLLPGQNIGSTCLTFGYVTGQYIPANEPG